MRSEASHVTAYGRRFDAGNGGMTVEKERKRAYRIYELSALLGMACSIDKVIVDRAKVSPFI